MRSMYSLMAIGVQSRDGVMVEDERILKVRFIDGAGPKPAFGFLDGKGNQGFSWNGPRQARRISQPNNIGPGSSQAKFFNDSPSGQSNVE